MRTHEAVGDDLFGRPVPQVILLHANEIGAVQWDRLADPKRTEKALEEVRKLIETQVAAWNKGDLEAFTSVYADDAAFLAPSGLTRGRNEVLERYRAASTASRSRRSGGSPTRRSRRRSRRKG